MNRKIVLAAFGLLLLSGCSSTLNGMDKDLSILLGTAQHTDKKMTFGSSTDGKDWVDAKGQPIKAPTDKIDLSYANRAKTYTGGDVQLYSLDKPGEAIDHNAPVAMAGGVRGIPSSTDSSVTVFPFSNDMYTPGVRPDYNGYGRQPAPYGDGAMVSENPAAVVYFRNGSAVLNAVARQVIAGVAHRYFGERVLISGHASHHTLTKDPVEAALINLQISMKRAMAVTHKLVADGVPAAAIRVRAMGDTQPAVPETSRAAEAKNRRVEIRTGQR